MLREPEQRHGRFVVLDVHSYNHRREGLAGPSADPADNPEINVGTGTVDRSRRGGLIDRFCADLRAPDPGGRRLDVRAGSGRMSAPPWGLTGHAIMA